MKISRLLVLLCCVCLASPLLAEQALNKDNSGKVSIAGSDTLAKMVDGWAKAFALNYANVQFQLQASGSSSAPIALSEGTAILGTMSRQMSQSEKARFITQYGYEPLEIPIAIDALAVFVHQDNPLQGITLAQIDSIFSMTRYCGGGSDIDHWHQLTRDDRYYKRKIKLYGRNVVSGTYGFVKDRVLCAGDFKANLNQMLGSSAVIQAIDNDPFGIGYSAISFKSSRTRALMVKNSAGNFVEASVLNAVSGRYPLARFMYLYVNNPPSEPLDAVHKAFVSYILSEQGQTIVRTHGYVPLSTSVRRSFIEKLSH